MIRRAISEHARTIHIPTYVTEQTGKCKRVLAAQNNGEIPRGKHAARTALAKLLSGKLKGRDSAATIIMETVRGPAMKTFANADTLAEWEMPTYDSRATAEQSDELAMLLPALTDRESEIIKLRYGLEDGHPMTLEQIGARFNVTRERIRQIEARALAKMRAYGTWKLRRNATAP